MLHMLHMLAAQVHRCIMTEPAPAPGNPLDSPALRLLTDLCVQILSRLELLLL